MATASVSLSNGTVHEPINEVKPNKDCPICSLTFLTKQEYNDHLQTDSHEKRFLIFAYLKNKTKFLTNRNGVDIIASSKTENTEIFNDKNSIKCGMPQGRESDIRFTVRNNGGKDVILDRIWTLFTVDELDIITRDRHDVSNQIKRVRIAKAGDKYEIDCLISPRSDSTGFLSVPIAFKFTQEEKNSTFFILKTLEINLYDAIILNCRPKEEYNAGHTHILPYKDIAKDYEKGIACDVKDDPLALTVLPQYSCPGDLRNCAAHAFKSEKLSDKLQETNQKYIDLMTAGLNPTNYPGYFDTMLWLEEIQMENDILSYNLKNAPLTKVPKSMYSQANCVELKVEGLAEKRPSLLKNDSIYISVGDSSRYNVEGKVHKICEKSIYVAFGNNFMSKFIDNMKVNVRFAFNRNPLKCNHRAVSLVESKPTYERILFPKPVLNSQISNNAIRLYNRDIADNLPQLEAVKAIRDATSFPAPFLIFGPPGTGKTITIVEAIKQVHYGKNDTRILACAPSNSAANILAKRLLQHVQKTDIYRLIAVSQEVRHIPVEIRKISNVCGNEIFYPSLDEIRKRKIIVCTLITAGKLVSANLGNEFFTHIFLDECGYSTEPDALVPLSGLMNDNTQVVLAGDPYQLGPVVRSRLCHSLGDKFNKPGLDMSLLERLMNLPMYNGENRDKRVVAKLTKNYRSHTDIIQVPNKLFYNNELSAEEGLISHSLVGWEHLPNRKFPLIFHSIDGKDQREGKSPSFFNPHEVSTVVDYVDKLLNGRPSVQPKDIGIITPYRAQVGKIKQQILRKFDQQGGDLIKVGSVEEFQGDERLVIIISTVRASPNYFQHDTKYNIGFLQNPKRFNVALTRAKAMVILVGFPNILNLDRCWSEFLHHVQQNNGYIGKKFGSSELDALSASLAHIKFDTDAVKDSLAYDKEWRSEQ